MKHEDEVKSTKTRESETEQAPCGQVDAKVRPRDTSIFDKVRFLSSAKFDTNLDQMKKLISLIEKHGYFVERNNIILSEMSVTIKITFPMHQSSL